MSKMFFALLLASSFLLAQGQQHHEPGFVESFQGTGNDSRLCQPIQRRLHI